MTRVATRTATIVLILGTAVLAGSGSGRAEVVSACGSLTNEEGPFDYRSAPPKTLDLVQRYHFTESVAALQKGSSTIYIGADISYTLRWFPNHPRALLAMAELARREKKDPPTGSPYTVQCWFQRAIEFRPDDEQVRAIYGITLLRDGKRSLAIEQLRKALTLAPNDANAHYNLGLAYFDEKRYEEARVEAKAAYALGFPLPGLRDMLKRENQWK